MLTCGGLLDRFEHVGVPFPGFLGWALLGLTVVGGVLVPISSLWLLLMPIAGVFIRPRCRVEPV